jgi:hypothetical protein
VRPQPSRERFPSWTPPVRFPSFAPIHVAGYGARRGPSVIVGGWSLIAVSLLFWMYWFLMPEPGTVDASYILAAIAEQRGSVLLSAILQTLCAIAIVPAALSVVGVRSRLVYTGALLLLVGALGNAPDAVYHQMAYEMTASDVDPAAMLPVMTRMQTEQIWLLAPLLLAFFPAPSASPLGWRARASCRIACGGCTWPRRCSASSAWLSR